MIEADTLIGFGIIAIIILVVYSNIQKQSILDTLKGIKEGINELRGETTEWETT